MDGSPKLIENEGIFQSFLADWKKRGEIEKTSKFLKKFPAILTLLYLLPPMTGYTEITITSVCGVVECTLLDILDLKTNITVGITLNTSPPPFYGQIFKFEKRTLSIISILHYKI